MGAKDARDTALLTLITAFNVMTRQAKLVAELDDNDPSQQAEKLVLEKFESELWALHADYSQKYGLIQQYQLSATFH